MRISLRRICGILLHSEIILANFAGTDYNNIVKKLPSANRH